MHESRCPLGRARRAGVDSLWATRTRAEDDQDSANRHFSFLPLLARKGFDSLWANSRTRVEYKHERATPKKSGL